MIIWKLFFLVFCPPREVPDPENQAKTLEGCAKTRVPPFQEKQHFFTKTNQKLPPLGPPKAPKNWKNVRKDPSKTELKKLMKKTPEMKKKSSKVAQGKASPPDPGRLSHPGAPPEQSLS